MSDSSTQARDPLGTSTSALPQYWIPTHIHLCRTASGAILLDLKRNRYYGIGKTEARAIHTLELNRTRTDESATDPLELMPLQAATRIANHLVEIGLLSQSRPTDRPLTPGVIELNGALTSVGHEVNRSVRIGLGHIVHFLRACVWAKKSVRSRTLLSVAREIEDNKSRHLGKFDDGRAIELVCVFRRLRPFAFTANDQCLFHALALIRFLSSYEVFPAWVIGVRARPWAAHSWVQQGSLLLDSNPEHVCEYTPILTV